MPTLIVPLVFPKFGKTNQYKKAKPDKTIAKSRILETKRQFKIKTQLLCRPLILAYIEQKRFRARKKVRLNLIKI